MRRATARATAIEGVTPPVDGGVAGVGRATLVSTVLIVSGTRTPVSFRQATFIATRGAVAPATGVFRR